MPQSLEESYEALEGGFAERTTATSPATGLRSSRRSSRPTTSAASTATRWTATPPTCSAAAFARVLAELRGKPAADLRVGLGRDMRLRRPRWPGGFATGWSTRAPRPRRREVGTEMLYFLVGSRELDGGAMVTASHNPKAYTGVKLVREGALPLSGDAGIGEHPRPDRRRACREAAAAAASIEDVDVYDGVPGARARVDRRRREVKPLKVVVDGGNGMAGPMVGPLLERLDSIWSTTYWEPDGELPRPRAEPAAARRTASSSSSGSAPRAPTSGSPGTATPTAASSSTTGASSSTATS